MADCPEGVDLVFGDLPSVLFGAHHPGTEEYLTKQQFLTQCVLALSVRDINCVDCVMFC